MTKNRIIRLLLCFFLGFVLAGGITAANTPSANASVGLANVGNETSKNVKVACSYGGPLTVLKPGQHSMMPGKCTKSRSDVDQILTTTTVIMIFTGPVKADGCYRLSPGTRAKVPDLSVTTLYNLSRGCRGKKYRGYWTYR